jgi:uncharacterized protein YbjT (DUF2867 family)
MQPILVIGATGNVGKEVMRSLLKAGQPVRAAVTNIEKARAGLESEFRASLESKLLEVVRFEFGDLSSYAASFAGVSACFLMRPPAVADTKRLILPAIDVGVALGVRRWAFLSLQGAQANPVVPHRAVEQHLEQLGKSGAISSYTFLRASFFMQNLSTTHRADIAKLGDIFIPAGNGKTAFVDVRDIAAVAVKALTASDPDLERLGLHNAGVELTSASALGYAEVAAIMTRVLGRTITYSNPSPLAFGLHLNKQRVPLAQILVMEALYTVAKLGLAGKLTGEVQRILGRAPISLEQFVRDEAAAWSRE